MWSEFPGHVRRFFRGFSRALSPSEVAHARRLLTPAELLLFAGLPGRERRHAMDMLHWLRARAAPSDELLAAALVHNVGKGPIHLQERVAYVLLDLLTPELLERIASPSGVRFQRSLAAQRDHPRRGAALLDAAGSTPRVQALVREHHDPPPADDRELAWLIAADTAC